MDKCVFLLVVVLLMPGVFAIPVVNAGAAVASSAAARQAAETAIRVQAGCVLPIDFVVEHKCSLRLESAYEPLAYTCYNNAGSWKLLIDCKGGVLQQEYSEAKHFWQSPGQIVFLGGGMFALYWFLFRKGGNEDKFI